MKRALIILSFLVAELSNVYANDAGYICEVEGRLSGIGISVGLGGQVLTGNGYVTCIDNQGNELFYPVGLEFISGGFGLDITWVRDLMVRSAPVRVANGFVDFEGKYAVGATVGLTLIGAGIDFDAALVLTGATGDSFEIGLSGRDAIGIGVRLHASLLKIHRKPRNIKNQG